MSQEHYYHMFANGDDAKNFITEECELKTAFNRFAVCQHLTGISVLSFSVEDSHPHALLWGTYEDCLEFKNIYEQLSLRSIVQSRGSKDDVHLLCEIMEIEDEQHLMNVGTYTIVQPTKDGKAVMPYDYLYGTGPLYFRSKSSVMPWLVGADGNVVEAVPYSNLTTREKRNLCGTHRSLPDKWLVCNGFVLPSNYVDIKKFENIYKTHNCFRAFLSSGKSRDEEILRKMACARGLVIEDLQARELCEKSCMKLFSASSPRGLDTYKRITLAQDLRKEYQLSYRQLSFLVKVPESELRKYVK